MEDVGKVSHNWNFISLASVISALAVVTLHTNGCFWAFSSTESYWFSANIIECVFFFAVPVFFMISGATNLDYFDKYSTKVFYLKRIKKTVFPYIAWSLIAVLFLVCLKKKSLSEISFESVVKGLSEFNTVSLYWFFGPLFAVYLCMPLFAAVQKERKKNVFVWMVILSFAFNLLAPFIVRVFNIDYTFPLTVTVGSSYLIYVMLGYLLYTNDISPQVRIIIYLLAIAGLLSHIIGTYTLSIAQGSIVSTYKGYVAVPSALYSSGVFVLIKQLSQKIKSKKIWGIISFLSKYTFSLYLMQWFIMFLVDNYTKIDTFSLWYRLGAPPIIFAIVIIVTFCLRKIPVVKYIVP